jgi:molecular chaperone GrpE
MSAEKDNDALPEETAETPASDEPEQLKELMAQLRAEADAHRDRALRALAEVENVRKRLERERDEARTYSVTRFAREMLTVADNLNRALAALPAELRNNAGDALKGVLEGVEATERELKAALARHGVQQIDAEGKRFDPHLHQAIAEVPAQNAEPGMVMHVVQQGYTIGDRLLRPAMVTVVKSGASAPANDLTPPGGSGDSQANRD